MPFEIIRNDITNMVVDAIVNSANPRPVVGLGTDSMIHQKAGPRLLEARQKIGPLRAGQAAVTPAFDLDALYVIHTVGPVWMDGTHGEERLLRDCYTNSLALAKKLGCQSIAFPLIATNNYGFPKDKALQIAMTVFSEFLMESEMQIYLVVFDRSSYKLSEKLFQGIASYIDENYVDSTWQNLYGGRAQQQRQALQRQQRDLEFLEEPDFEELDFEDSDFEDSDCCMSFGDSAPAPCSARYAPAPMPGAVSLKELLEKVDEGFSQTLLRLIDKSGKKDSEIYKKANLSKQHFSKIRNNPDYKPTKQTAIALAIALELDLEGTRDLIGRAGYALSNSSKFDLIIRYFIERRQYNVVQINMALYEFDQSLLGG